MMGSTSPGVGEHGRSAPMGGARAWDEPGGWRRTV